MSHAELKPYPFPEGMAIPRLMPFQEYPWNGDHFIAEEVLRLKTTHGLTNAIETGTCLGSTSIWLLKNFHLVHTTDVVPLYAEIAEVRIGKVVGRVGGRCIQGCPDTGENLIRDTLDPQFHSRGWDKPFIFLDAHWGNHCPLLDELNVIAESNVKPCILIHDFQVPGTDFGYDSMPDGRPFNMELVKPYLDRIYGEGKYKTNYPTEVAGARRGWISIEPA